ncbi:diguanylate cyclase [Iodobacter arcticus]|uniref:diguanylate cyclase n=1 Tax=Iodobacter arcticus TaxID=590593 RepID=A0ABW2R1X5_9NEIS
MKPKSPELKGPQNRRADYNLRYAQDLLVQARVLAHCFDESMALMRHSLLLGEEFGFREHVMHCLQEIAVAYYAQCEYDLSLQYWSYCLDVSLNLSNDEAYIQAQIGIGQIYFAHDDFAAALEHHLQAAESLPRINNHVLSSSLLINLGADYVQLLQYAEAISALQEGLLFAQKANHSQYIPEALGLIGQAQWGLGDRLSAEQTLQSALTLNRQINRLWGMASNLLALGRLHLVEKNTLLATTYLTEGLSKAMERNALHMVFQFEQLLAELAELRGNYPLALSHFKRFHFGKEAIKSQLSPHKLQAMKMQLEMESARLENADLRRQRASQHREIQRVERLASYDGLTGILNRRGLEEQGCELFQRQRINRQSLSVLMIDVDHFKRVNDGCGHPIGDKVLRQIAALLKSGCRQDDLVGRYGGEEFVVLLPNHEGVAAIEVGERLRGLVEAWIWSRIHPELKITISVGIASTLDDASLEALLNRSDQCLYQAKQQGRNRVVV